MDIQRAQQIVESPILINVDYHGIPVYIKEVHTNNGMASVFPLDEMHNEQEVEIGGLNEQGPSSM